MKKQTALLSMFHAKQLSNSVNGNPRWKFTALTADGSVLEFKTASDVGCGYGCNLSRLKHGDVIRVEFHETRTGTLIVDIWDDGRSTGIDYRSQFDAFGLQHQLRADVRDPQTTQQPVRL